MDIWKLEARNGISGCGRDREIEGTETKLTTPGYSVGVTQDHPGWHSSGVSQKMKPCDLMMMNGGKARTFMLRTRKTFKCIHYL